MLEDLNTVEPPKQAFEAELARYKETDQVRTFARESR